EVAVSFDVLEVGALAAADEEGLVEADRAHRAHRRVHPAGNKLERAAEQFTSRPQDARITAVHISPSEAKAFPPTPENAQHFSGKLKPGGQLLRPVRDDEVGARSFDRRQRLERSQALFQASLRCGCL